MGQIGVIGVIWGGALLRMCRKDTAFRCRDGAKPVSGQNMAPD